MLRSITIVVALLGGVLLAKGLWIPAKAQLAYGLLERAYTRAANTGGAQKPWDWADFGVIARLHIKDKTIHVLDRATDQAMAFGAGRHEEYDMDTGPLVLSGHRDTHFGILEQISVGDQITYQSAKGANTYRVSETRIYDIREGTIYPPGKDEILLMTCWPFDAIEPDTPKRFLVLANVTPSMPL